MKEPELVVQRCRSEASERWIPSEERLVLKKEKVETQDPRDKVSCDNATLARGKMCLLVASQRVPE